jgi:hypothetical protein
MKSVVILVIACSAVLAAFLAQPIEYLTGAFVIDDGLYYLEVSRNIVADKGVTYDNRTSTNGFHPLWGGIGVVMAWTTGGRTDALLRMAFVIQAILLIVGLLCLGRFAIDLGFTPLGTMAAILFLFFSRADLCLSTMESALLIATILLLCMVSLRRDLLRSTKTSDNVLLGTLLAVVFLSRLDTIFIVVAFLAVQAVIGIRSQTGLRAVLPAIRTGIVFTLLNMPYLIINRVYFGSIVPVSGVKKTGVTSHVFDNIFTLVSNVFNAAANKLGVQTWIVGLVVLVVAIVVALTFRRPSSRYVLTSVGRGGVLTALTAGVFARGVYLLVFIEEYTRVPWYWVPEYVLAAIVAGIAVTLVTRELRGGLFSKPKVVYTVTAIVFMAGCVYLVKDASANQYSNLIAYRTAIWVRDNTPEDTLLAMHDSGVLAYFSERDVIPLNGLITDRPTMEKLRRGEYREVLDQFSVDYYVRLMDQNTDVPERILVYRSDTLDRGVYAGMQIFIMDYGSFPEQTASFLPDDGPK